MTIAEHLKPEARRRRYFAAICYDNGEVTQHHYPDPDQAMALAKRLAVCAVQHHRAGLAMVVDTATGQRLVSYEVQR